METNYLNENLNKRDRRLLFFIMFVPCLLIRRVLDNDTWFLLNSGRYVMEHGIPYMEPFSIHENLKFVMQQWLTDVAFWNLYNKFGEQGLFMLVTICYATIILLMFKLTMSISDRNFMVSFSVTMISSILIFTYMVTRPTIITLILVLLELNALESYVKSKNYKYLFILPILSLFMINMHAALWPILFILILPYIVGAFQFKFVSFVRDEYNINHLLLSVIAMIIVAFINPYGIDAMTYLINSSGYPYMKKILELQPPYINSIPGALIYFYIFSIVLIYIFYRTGKFKIRYLLLTLGTTYMVLISIRNITYFAICSSFPIAYYLKDIGINQNNAINNKFIKLRLLLITLITAALVIGIYFGNINNSTYKNYSDLNSAVDYLLKSDDTSNIKLFTGFNDGSLVQFRGIRTYIDPRAEVYFIKQNGKDDIFNEYFDLITGKIYYKDIINKYKFTHMLITKGELLDTYLNRDTDYEIIYENEEYNVYKNTSK